ncbi:glycosyltransferase family 2 protein [Alkalicoccus daliensis]|uniref:Glycosyltransferase involved in cell wall bisynthesis n=1 Tax=Alkalicoccus daliensis TaxID=745820 RepID=A0A1G9ZLN4_9BACI|nr:glycosyltransferase [Alkalicoccus daliensis]SDN22015.1 Glycosyltransferase involved in cell wall bisynthesis [Alkalicoccus daliensis]
MKPLVSVIVPVYKVEKYILFCLESILNQTYDHLQIIIVNDGTTDKSRELAASYKDERIQIIDKENGGLSDARNAGMAQVKGDYTVFIDSDDWLDPEFIEKTLKIAVLQKAEVVQSSFYYAYPDKLLLDNKMFSNKFSIELLDNNSLMEKLLENEEVKNFAWGKIYQTNVIRSIPFRKGMLFEDMFWAHLVMAKVKTYVINREPLYYYRQREESIVGKYTLKHLDIIEGMKERVTFIEENYKGLTSEAYRQLGKLQLEHYRLLLTIKPYRDQKKQRSIIERDLKREKDTIIKAAEKDKELSKKLKMFYIHPTLYLTQLLFNKLKRKMNKHLPEESLIKVNRS